jgi:hypothetical protein
MTGAGTPHYAAKVTWPRKASSTRDQHAGMWGGAEPDFEERSISRRGLEASFLEITAAPTIPTKGVSTYYGSFLKRWKINPICPPLSLCVD